ncbi:MAG: LysM peptidoglycan-binding domain-containing protein [Candidatus Saganbacteria bacterium]|nr:LysM peptidoglycan-binding domain-containing protein [Candidatus Saganbacteria bacterium]
MNALGSIDNNNTCGASNWKPRVPSKAEFEVTNNLDGTTTINYTIKCGDTLYHISRAIKEHFGIDISYQAIADQNGIANAGKIKAGQSLEIEVGKSKASAAPSKPKEKSAPKEKPASLPQPIYEEGSPYDLYTTQPVIMSENVPLEWWEEEVDVSLSDADVVVEPEAEDPLPSSLAAMCRQDPSWLEDVLVRNNLVMEARGAIRDGNYDLAREDAAQLVMSGGDKALDNAADLYFEIGDSLFAQGRYEEAEQVYWEVAHRFDGANRKTPVFEADSVEVQGRFGSFYLDNVHLNISELANARMAQCQFLERAEVSDPFDLSEVGRYFRSLPSNRLADELNTYLSAFYFILEPILWIQWQQKISVDFLYLVLAKNQLIAACLL